MLEEQVAGTEGKESATGIWKLKLNEAERSWEWNERTLSSVSRPAMEKQSEVNYQRSSRPASLQHVLWTTAGQSLKSRIHSHCHERSDALLLVLLVAREAERLNAASKNEVRDLPEECT
jgi:hypothetical protein